MKAGGHGVWRRYCSITTASMARARSIVKYRLRSMYQHQHEKKSA